MAMAGDGGPEAPAPQSAAPGAAEATHLALMMATRIGLHNFAEGLAIGSSAASGDLSLAVLVVIGFALHDAAEGSSCRPHWPRSGCGRPGGGWPCGVRSAAVRPAWGTLVGQSVVSDILSIAFLGLAAGSVLYVFTELLRSPTDRPQGAHDLVHPPRARTGLHLRRRSSSSPARAGTSGGPHRPTQGRRQARLHTRSQG